MRIITNLSRLATVKSEQFDIDLHDCTKGYDGVGGVFSLYLKSFGYDYVLLNGSGSLIFKLALLKWLIPFNPVKLVVLDILLSSPASVRGRVKTSIIRLLLKKVDLMLLYYRDTRGLQDVYGIPASKFRYTPFKINKIELVREALTSDGGYIFCGGKTRRDFATLFEAVKDTDLRVRVVTTDNNDIRQHGSYLDMSAVPPNVEVVILDGSVEQFITHLAGSRLVVMPIIPEICGAGIGVYIMSMALRKCVVITDIPGTSDTLPPDTAVIVPPNDPEALRVALSRAYHDEDYRSAFERAGYEYAWQLGGEDRLMHSVAQELYSDLVTAGRGGDDA